jgi:hypothetical protein
MDRRFSKIRKVPTKYPIIRRCPGLVIRRIAKWHTPRYVPAKITSKNIDGSGCRKAWSTLMYSNNRVTSAEPFGGYPQRSVSNIGQAHKQIITGLECVKSEM